MRHGDGARAGANAGGLSAIGRTLRHALAGLLAIALLAAVLGAAVVVAVAAFAVAVIATLVVGVGWAISKVLGVRRQRRRRADADVLIARKGPHGWTVDAAG